jgi:hypothetical protein
MDPRLTIGTEVRYNLPAHGCTFSSKEIGGTLCCGDPISPVFVATQNIIEVLADGVVRLESNKLYHFEWLMVRQTHRTLEDKVDLILREITTIKEVLGMVEHDA